MKKAIEHFMKLLTCEQFIITGSYALHILGLTDRVNDLDIVLVKPDEEAIAILKKLKVENPNPDYPESPDQYRVLYENIHVDFFIVQAKEKCIPVIHEKQLLLISMPVNIMEAKRRFLSLKQLLQRKQIAELFYKESEMETFINDSQQKVRNGGTKIKSTPLPSAMSEILGEEDFDEEDFDVVPMPLRKSKPKK